MNKIYKNNLYYKLLIISVKSVYKRYFRQIEIRGVEHIPVGEPVIFAGNHQNALMDALAILFFQTEPIVFMARADMFENKLAAQFLKSLKIAPIYRIRDGFENLSKNEQQMNGAVEVLLAHHQLCLMPEGNQGHQHKLRPLVKGLFRIAYAAEERLNNQAHVQIVPVGIDYNDYQHAGSDLVVSYGKPIQVKEYIDLYKENPANGLNVLRERLATEMSCLMQDVTSMSNYDRIYRLSCYGTPALLDYMLEQGERTQADTMAGLRFDARCKLSRILDRLDRENPQKIEELDKLCQRIQRLPGTPAQVSEWMDANQNQKASNILALLSVFLIPGFLMNFPIWLATKKIRKTIDDTQMHSTFAFALGMLLNCILYVVIAILIARFVEGTLVWTLFAIVFVTAYGLITERVRQSLRMPLHRLWHSFGKRKELVDACKADFIKLQAAIRAIL